MMLILSANADVDAKAQQPPLQLHEHIQQAR
jgi:hypothetical protein